MDHCEAALTRKWEEIRYRAYVTDSLRLHGENKYLLERWADKIPVRKTQSVPLAPGEAASRIRAKLRGGSA